MATTLRHPHRVAERPRASVPGPLPLTRPAPPALSPEQVRRRAYEIFLARQGGAGDALSDWLQAEREMAEAAALERHQVARGEALLHDAD